MKKHRHEQNSVPNLHNAVITNNLKRSKAFVEEQMFQEDIKI